jgi:predicted DNA-binding transcriptional regulator AlpA
MNTSSSPAGASARHPGRQAKPITGQSARPAQAALLFGVHISTIWRWVAERHDFPRPRKVGPRTTVFDTAELIAFRDKSLGG